MTIPVRISNITVQELAKDYEIKEGLVFKRIVGESMIENFRSPDYYVIIVFEKCSGYHSVDFKKYEERNHQVHISFPGQIHSWTTGAETVGYKFYISKALMDRLVISENHFTRGSVNRFPVLDVNEGDFKKLKTEFSAMERELNAEKEVDVPPGVILARVQLIVLLVSHLVDKKEGEEASLMKGNKVLLSFHALINENFKKWKSVKFYAGRLSVSSNYLNILCRRHYSLSAKEVIMKRVFLEAKRLLGGTKMSIKEVTFELGFTDPAHFSTFIKNETGMSPKVFKDNLCNLGKVAGAY